MTAAEEQDKYRELDAAIANLGLTYSAEFVSFSKSRNAKPIKKPSDLSLNWKVTISKGSRAIITDYQQGIGHIPGFRPTTHGMTIAEEEAVRYACEHGKAIPKRAEGSLMPALRAKPIPAPLLRDVLYALTADADALNYPSFEEWASNCGYDLDSRKAEGIYRACLDLALQLRSMIGEDGLATLRAAFQDY